MLLDYFNALTFQSFAAFVATAQEEHLSLDFKTVGGAELNSGSDKRNLAEALSGFANSAGGIVIWGVATAKNEAGQDVATLLKPIDNIARFATRLEEFTALLVTPNVVGVQNRRFEDSAGAGFAATFVPESESGPHMALAGHDRYFKRAGDRFYPMEHYDVSDMFGRRQKPALRLGWSLISGGSGGGERTLRVLLRITNDGRASATAPYVRLYPGAAKIYPFGSTLQGGVGLQLVTDVGYDEVPFVVGQSTFIVHPKVSFSFAQLHYKFKDSVALNAIQVQYGLAALNLPLTQGLFVLEPEKIAQVIRRSVAGAS
jgi:hypothetical protein